MYYSFNIEVVNYLRLDSNANSITSNITYLKSGFLKSM